MKTKLLLLFVLLTSSVVAQNNVNVSKNTNESNYVNEAPTQKVVATKRVLIEEGTGTWCGFCVKGIVYMDEINTLYPNTTALVSVHWDDVMAVPEYQAGTATLISALPSGLVDRQGATDPSVLKAVYLSRVKYITPIDVFISDVNWNPTTRLISFKVNATTVTTFNGNYRFNAVITEMAVHGTTSAYNQHNYYSNNAYGPMGGFESKPDPIPASEMYYDFVGRTTLGGWAGTEGSIPTSNASGVTISYTYTKTIPVTWNENKLSLIGFVINSTTGLVENVSKSNMIINEIGENFKTELVVYPNPTDGIINIRNSDLLDIEVLNILGEKVKFEQNVNQIDLSEFENGIYILKLYKSKELVHTRRIILTK